MTELGQFGFLFTYLGLGGVTGIHSYKAIYRFHRKDAGPGMEWDNVDRAFSLFFSLIAMVLWPLVWAWGLFIKDWLKKLEDEEEKIHD